MTPPPRAVLSGGQKLAWFAIGFVCWFLLNGALGGWAYWLGSIGNDIAQAAALLLSGLLLLANPAALVVLAFFPRGQWAALGALAALAVAFCVVLILGATLAAICFSNLGSGNL